MKKFALILSLLFAIVNLQAQDYKITFAATGASNSVGSITVENLTQGKSITLLGSESLHLVGTITGIDPTVNDVDNALRIFPNPMTDISKIGFIATASGISTIELFDIAGKRVGTAQKTLTIGNHSYQVSGLGSGIYTVRINSQAYSYSGKLVSNGTLNSELKISYLGYSIFPVIAQKLKNASAEKVMQYSTGDRLKITGISGNYSTVSTDIPTQSKTLTFNFVACTDGDGNNYSVVQIGTQLWIAENLKTTKYRNGELIETTIPETLDISGLAAPKYQWVGGDGNDVSYGRIYTWYAATDNRNISPTGWHVATDAEWTSLITYLDGEDAAGGKLKETGTTHWKSPNKGAGNESGFTAIAANN